MSTPLPLSILLLTAIGAASQASAQTRREPYQPIEVRASLGDGRVSGLVLDEGGAGVGGVSILATGTTLAVARSDSRGRFALVLPVGEYLLRATRDGYLSTYREPIRIEPNRHLQRRIRLIRDVEPTSAASAQIDPQPDATPAPEEMHGHGEMAWRLRHLKRTVLRDEAPFPATEGDDTPFDRPVGLTRWVDRAIGQTARSASSFLAGTDFTGHVNLLTTSALPGLSSDVAADWSRGIANVFLAAPVGQAGDWAIRGAVAAGDASSWALLGEYEGRESQRHAVRFTMSYSTQGFAPAGDLTAPADLPESRSVGVISASDRWRLRSELSLDYGLRFDHFDYLSEPSLISPHAGLRAEVRPGTVVRASTLQRMIAPGADEFLPPSDAGPWLPPVRTFFPLQPGAEIRAERIRRHAVGLDQNLGQDRTRRVSVEWFTEETDNQMATLFGVAGSSEAGSYYVATVGDVVVTGWRLGLEGTLARNLTGRVDYTEGKAQWYGTRAARLLRVQEPSVSRRGRESVSDLRGRLNVEVPSTSTHFVFGYQVTRLDPETAKSRSLADDGFDLELKQRLPYQPLTTGILHLVFTLSTLVHQHDAESLYDEILTSEAPTRLTAGIQVGF
jgi:hypothetical protein